MSRPVRWAAALVLVAVAAVGCRSFNCIGGSDAEKPYYCKGSTQQPPSNAGAAAPTGPASCLDLCRHGQALSCKWAEPTPAGAPCEDVCTNNQQAGITPWDLDCRTRATSCAAPGCR